MLNKRLKILYVPENELLSVLRGDIALLTDLNLPLDAQVDSLFPCFERRAIGVVIASQSYEEVEPGQIFPEIPTHPLQWKPLRRSMEHIADGCYDDASKGLLKELDRASQSSLMLYTAAIERGLVSPSDEYGRSRKTIDGHTVSVQYSGKPLPPVPDIS